MDIVFVNPLHYNYIKILLLLVLTYLSDQIEIQLFSKHAYLDNCIYNYLNI